MFPKFCVLPLIFFLKLYQVPSGFGNLVSCPYVSKIPYYALMLLNLLSSTLELLKFECVPSSYYNFPYAPLLFLESFSLQSNYSPILNSYFSLSILADGGGSDCGGADLKDHSTEDGGIQVV